MITNILSILIGYIGRRIFWRINSKDKIYLENYYKRLAAIDGDTEYAKTMTDVERKKIVNMREADFWGRLANLFS